MTLRLERAIPIPGGRLLGYAEYGDSTGAPIIYLHGFMGSRLDWKYLVGAEKSPRRAARVIAVDRPGIGSSQYQARRRLLDWPDDVVVLADELHLDRFAVLGASGGGPYAAACAYKIPQRLTRVGIVAGMGPSNAPGAQDGPSWTLIGRNRLVRRALASLTARTLRSRPERFLGQMEAQISEADQKTENSFWRTRSPTARRPSGPRRVTFPGSTNILTMSSPPSLRRVHPGSGYDRGCR